MEQTIYSFLDTNYIMEQTNLETIDMEEISSYFTDYFLKFDYVLGDYAYHKLRLKGFYKSDSKMVSAMNNIASFEQYLRFYCADGCAYFLLKKI